MFASDRFKDMYDPKLKSPMLRFLIREHLPDENEPGGVPVELTKVVSLIQTYKLLTEAVNESIEKKLAESWESAVSEAVDRVLHLVSSNMSDKCWTGICLLGVTCQESSFDRFMASYPVWFNKLYSVIQQSTDSRLVKVASCNSMSDLLTRLGAIPNAKKDGGALAGKLIQLVLKLLNEDSSEAVWEGAAHLLCTILNFFPASVHRNHDSAEAAIVSKLCSGKCSVNMMKKLVHCLALLPNSRGDEDSWCLMMQKILLFINAHLNDAFQGLEEETKGSEAVRGVVPPGKDPPPPLGGGHTLLGEAVDKATKRSERMQMSSISMLILCCSTMLTNQYPVQVTVPIRALLALVDRVLTVDGSVPRASLPFTTAMQQASVCLELPALHFYCLELLTAIVEGNRSQLLPHTAYIVRLVKEYFKRCALPELRIKLYSLAKLLLIFTGVGMALYFAQEIVENAFCDLNPVGDEGGRRTSTPNSKATSLISLRKRKHGTTAGSMEVQHDIIGLEVEASKNLQTSPISVKIAALEALEALLTMGGGLRSESWQSNVDLLLITFATDSCKEGWGNEKKNTFVSNEQVVTWADLQLASFRTLLASLLSSVRVRPPYLSRGLELFRRGKQEAGPKLAGFCSHALLVLEVLIHPRALPLEHFPSTNYNTFDRVNRRFPDNIYSGGQKHITPCSSAMPRMGHNALDSDDDDDLCNKWVGNGNPSEAPLNGSNKTRNDTISKPCETLEVHWAEKPSVAGSSGTQFLEEQAHGEGGNKENESLVEVQELVSSKSATDGDPKGDEMEIERAAPDGGLDNMDDEIASGKDLSALTNVGGIAKEKSYTENDKATVLERNEDSETDSFPELVEGDPDSDEE